MSDHGRSNSRTDLLRQSLVIGAILALSHAGHALAHPWPNEMVNDAALNEICFSDAKTGWAVGDRGAILATEDGGRTWRLQASPVSCQLNSVFFHDSKRGWAVGGYATPYTHRSRGVVLQTLDGGATWHSLPASGQPWLRQVRMLDDRRGVAWGDGTTLCPGGVTSTADRGRSWQPMAGAELVSWQAGDFRPDGSTEADWHGFVLGDHRPMVFDGRRMRTGRPPADRSDSSIRAATWIDSRHAIAVGDRGHVWFSEDGGRSWLDKTDRLPPGVIGQFDWQAVTSDGRQVWVAGQPGTSVLTSDDGGQHWRVSRTDQALGLRDLCFCDGQLWAAGELGTVLHSSDRGRSWQVQRGVGRRAGLLAVFADERHIPWSLLAKVAARDGWRCVVAVADRAQDLSDSAELRVSRAVRSSTATTAVGGAAAVTFQPSPSDPSPSLVRLIREWRPEVVLTDPPGAEGTNRLHRLVLAAAESAADPNSLVDQVLIADLKPWAIDSVAWESERPEPHVWMTVPSGEVIATWGRVLDDVVRSATSLVEAAPRRSRTTSYYVKQAIQLPNSAVQRSHDSWLAEIRRPAAETSAEDVERLRVVVANQRAFQLIRSQLREVLDKDTLTDHERLTRGTAVWGQVQAVVAQLDSQRAGTFLWDLAGQFRDAGQLSMAHQLLQQISSLHDRHHLADVARQEMIRLQTSDEWRWRFRDVAPLRWPNLSPGIEPVQVLAGPTPNGIIAVETLPPLGAPRRGQFSRPLGAELEQVADEKDTLNDAGNPSGPSVERPVAQATHVVPVVAGDVAPTVPAPQALPQALLRHLQAVDPVLASDPLVRLALASQLRQEDQHDLSRQQYTTITKTTFPRCWRSTAAAELWFARREGRLPAVAASCRTGVRPHLDGQLGDPIWRTAKAIHWPLDGVAAGGHPGPKSPATSVKWARDERFLYLAISCHTDQPPPTGGTSRRDRDPDLTGSDRVEISMDVDRDYLSRWRLTVDRQGRVADACDEASDWDPQWYVAQHTVRWDHGSDWQWTVEAAIAWNQLVPQLEAGDAWAIQIHRKLSDGRTIEWPPAPPGDQRRNRWGLLMME